MKILFLFSLFLFYLNSKSQNHIDSIAKASLVKTMAKAACIKISALNINNINSKNLHKYYRPIFTSVLLKYKKEIAIYFPQEIDDDETSNDKALKPLSKMLFAKCKKFQKLLLKTVEQERIEFDNFMKKNPQLVPPQIVPDNEISNHF